MKAQTLKMLISACVCLLAVTLAPTAAGQFQYERLKSFGPGEETGILPSELIEGSDGSLYGFTVPGCVTPNGTTFECSSAKLFRLNKDGSNFTLLRDFTATNDNSPSITSLFEGSDDLLYGATSSGGSTNWVSIFKLNKDGSSYSVVFSTNGWWGASVIEASDGALYGTTEPAVFKLEKDGSGLTILRTFADDEGSYLSRLIEGTDGALYGVGQYGGTNGLGTIFKLNKDGTGFAVLHNFIAGGEGHSEYYPLELLEGSDGTLYGTTAGGGANDWGTVFSLNKNGGGYKVLHSSSGDNGEGYPSSLVEGNNGVLYGTKSVPCRERCLFARSGGIFTLSKDGSGYAVLHSFTNTNWTQRVEASALMKSGNGALYGTTRSGGEMSLGTVFALRPQPVLLPPIVSTDSVSVRFTSLLGSTNQVQRAEALNGSWLTLTNLVASTNGVLEFTDQASLAPSAFYRVVQVR